MDVAHGSIDDLSVPPGALWVEYLGQAGFRIKAQKTSFLIDPYLSNYVVDGGFGSPELFSREFPPPESPGDMHHLDFIFITHDHADHCDPQTILPLVRENPEVRIICPPTAMRALQEQGVGHSQFLEPVEGQWLTACDLAFNAIPSAHYERELDPVTGTDIYLGYVIRVNDIVLYHSGDTILYPGLLEQLHAASDVYDLVCLPVNGRDAGREALGITGNLDSEEALELALQLHAGILLPMHNDLFAANRVSPAILANLINRMAPGQQVQWLQPGELYKYVKQKLQP